MHSEDMTRRRTRTQLRSVPLILTTMAVPRSALLMKKQLRAAVCTKTTQDGGLTNVEKQIWMAPNWTKITPPIHIFDGTPGLKTASLSKSNQCLWRSEEFRSRTQNKSMKHWSLTEMASVWQNIWYCDGSRTKIFILAFHYNEKSCITTQMLSLKDSALSNEMWFYIFFW